MFITRKEFKREKEIRKLQDKEQWSYLKELTSRIDSLAKELGYEWTSEAVKETDRTGMIRIFQNQDDYERGIANLPEKAVLKWGWRKKDDFTEEWERQVEEKKLKSKSK